MRASLAALFCGLAWLTTVTASEPWTLERALEEGLARNTDAVLAEHRMAAAHAALAQANAAFWPRLQLQSSYTRTDNPMQVFGSILNQRAYNPSLDFNDVPDTDALNVRGVLTVPLYTGGRDQAARQAARANTDAARWERDAVRNQLSFAIARAFYTVLKARQFIRAAEAGVQAFDGNLAVARRRLEGGSILKTDVLDLEVRLAETREDLVRARNGLALAERVLRNLLGIEGGEFSVADHAPEIPLPDTSDFSRRAELAASRSRARAAEHALRGAKSGHLPRISAFGSLDYDHGWRTGEDGGSYTGGALLQWDIWDGQLTRAKVREAQAHLRIAREQERQVRLALDLELEQARLELQTASERLRVTAQAVTQAAESAAITRSRFEQGTALSTQVIDAETAWVAARVRRAEAEADERIAAAAYRKAAGLPQWPGQHSEGIQ